MKRHSHPATDVLAHRPPFDRFDERALRPLEPNTDRLRLSAGTVLARDREPVREFVLVVAGELVARDDHGNQRRLGPGASIGGDELLTGTTHHETVVAESDVDVVVVNGPAFRWAAAELFRAH